MKALLVHQLLFNQQRSSISNTKMADIQTERAFQKQTGVFLNSKKLLAKKTATGVRYYKKIGLGFKTPTEAIEGSYVDKKCPFTSDVSIRGRIFKGIVASTKMKRTIINRFEKRHKNLAAHCSPAFPRVREGDVVTVGQCRPLSKTVRFNVIKVDSKREQDSGKKQFGLF
ncbi:hypothetical protein FGO68_gene16151 [Halteria grandinella]|uniref:Small ribosomal subunit protein uS17 n=1 Tax=Halteria grandinella TaxID=5974 RepID=A0A8J8T1I0_HALGN|nr:hypothetical protein FGO68_gene16151 [Halteria grandinella]